MLLAALHIGCHYFSLRACLVTLSFECPRIPVSTDTIRRKIQIFASSKRTVVDELLGRASVPPDLLVAPIQNLSAALPDFLNHGDNQKACHFWKWDRANKRSTRAEDRKLA